MHSNEGKARSIQVFSSPLTSFEWFQKGAYDRRQGQKRAGLQAVDNHLHFVALVFPDSEI